MQDLAEIKVTAGKDRLAIICLALVAVILGWMSIAMQFGNLLAQTTTVIDPQAKNVADLALRLAPGDPQAHNLSALTAPDVNAPVEEAEKTVQISPSDFRWRVALGRAYEQDGRIDEAEQQFIAAVDQAPNYAFTRWNLGNFYLRQDRPTEAFDQLKLATVGHFAFREQVFALAWDYLDGDPSQVERVVSENYEARAYLARFFAQKRKGTDALRIWNQLDPNAKETYRAVGSLTSFELYEKGSYPEAQEIARQIGETNSLPEVIANPSFEEPLREGVQARFGWEYLPGEPRVDISLDDQNKYSDKRSLKLSFRAAGRGEYINLLQTVVVQPEMHYELSFWFRTEGLRSPARPSLQVVSANDNGLLASTEMFPADSKEWQKLTVQFRASVNTNAIVIRTYRPFCGEQCSLTGSLWYDQFELLRK
jgi:hypothetical protein